MMLKTDHHFLFFVNLDCSLTENKRTCLNLGSYNYLGFAASDEYCTPRVIESLEKFSQSTCSSRADGGKFLQLRNKFS
jgi:7-keto-8-aminopelargonate synthetase-like enzyme